MCETKVARASRAAKLVLPSTSCPRLVSQWDQILGYKEDGTPWLVPGLSILYYTGDGLFCYSRDLLNMTHIGEIMRAMEWRPPEGFNMPPRTPDRNVSLPPAWQHLEK